MATSDNATSDEEDMAVSVSQLAKLRCMTVARRQVAEGGRALTSALAAEAAAKAAADQTTRQLRNFRSSLCSVDDETARRFAQGQQQVPAVGSAESGSCRKMAVHGVTLDDSAAEQAALPHEVEDLPWQLAQLANTCWTNGGSAKVEDAQKLALITDLESQKLQLQEE
eukprot:gene2413-2717_t